MLGGISTKAHPPGTVMPSKAGHQGGRLLQHHHLLHQGILQPLDGSAPPSNLERYEKPISDDKDKSKIDIEKKMKKENDLKVEEAQEDIIEPEGKKEDKKKKPASQEDIQELEERRKTHLLGPEPGTNPTVSMAESSPLSGGPCGPETLLTSSLGSRDIRMTSVGSQGDRGLARGSPSVGNIGTLYRGGGDCQATNAAYNCTQFGDHGRTTTTDRYAVTNSEARRSTNLKNTMGLAEEHPRAVAIPRGDCNKKK